MRCFVSTQQKTAQIRPELLTDLKQTMGPRMISKAMIVNDTAFYTGRGSFETKIDQDILLRITCSLMDGAVNFTLSRPIRVDVHFNRERASRLGMETFERIYIGNQFTLSSLDFFLAHSFAIHIKEPANPPKAPVVVAPSLSLPVPRQIVVQSVVVWDTDLNRLRYGGRLSLLTNVKGTMSMVGNFITPTTFEFDVSSASFIVFNRFSFCIRYTDGKERVFSTKLHTKDDIAYKKGGIIRDINLANAVHAVAVLEEVLDKKEMI